MSKGDTGTQVRELQHRLHQLAWFPGDHHRQLRATTVEAVRGFQAKRKLQANRGCRFGHLGDVGQDDPQADRG